jgi:hypothetical protein
LAISIEADGDRYLDQRLALLDEKLRHVDNLAQGGSLVGVDISDELLTITPLKKAVPHAAEVLEDEACAVLPHVTITGLLLEVDHWCDFTRHFKTGTPIKVGVPVSIP